MSLHILDESFLVAIAGMQYGPWRIVIPDGIGNDEDVRR
jgi:hypothetical protein